MLPNIETEDRLPWNFRYSFHDGVVLVRGGCDLKVTIAGFNQPRPARSEDREGFLIKLLLHDLKAAEFLVDCVGERAVRCSAAVWGHPMPK